jgi:hypothetical protein
MNEVPLVPSFFFIKKDFSLTSVAKWPKFQLQNTKVDPYKSQQLEETAAECLQIFQKVAEKWPNFFAECFHMKALIICRN